MPWTLRKLLNRMGPGFITGASDDDPSGIATYSQAGAHFGYGMLWTALWCLPFMIAIQEMVARIGLITGQGIVAALHKRYPRWLTLSFVGLIFTANTINLGADLGAMADATKLLFPSLPFSFLLLAWTLLILFLEIKVPYKHYATILKWLALSLLAYLVTAVLVTTNWKQVLFSLFIPNFTLTRESLFMLIAIIGTTISPYLFIWQANQEVEEEIAQGKTSIKSRFGATKNELMRMKTDIIGGMASSQIIAACIIGTAAATFAAHGITTIETSAQAAQALEPLAGSFASTLFAIGIIGTGLLAVPVLAASGSYAVSEALGWKQGLGKTLHQAPGFYAMISVSTFLGMLMNIIGISPIKALIWTAILNGISTPPLLFVIFLVANNKKIMDGHTNGWLSNLLVCSVILAMTIATILLFVL